MGGYFVIGLPNCNKWKMTVICTSLHFGGAPVVTRVPILWTESAANVLPTHLWTELWSQYHSPFFTFKEGKLLRALFYPWCFFRLSSFASNILSLPITLEQKIHRTLSNVPYPSGSCWDNGYFAAQFFWNLHQNHLKLLRNKTSSKTYPQNAKKTSSKYQNKQPERPHLRPLRMRTA